MKVLIGRGWKKSDDIGIGFGWNAPSLDLLLAAGRQLHYNNRKKVYDIFKIAFEEKEE